MLAHLSRILLLILFPSILMGQSLELSVKSPTTNNSTSTFSLEGGEVTIRSNGFRFLDNAQTITGYESFGISAGGSVIGFLNRDGSKGSITLFNANGDSLYSFSSLTLAKRDPSLAIFPFDDGSVLLRDNIANFTFYNPLGEISANVSTSSETKEGEAIARVAMDPASQTIAIYNPKIKRGNNLGSQVQVKVSGGNFKNIFYSLDRHIKDIEISKDGSLISVITAKEGTNDQVILMDKYGNVLNTFDTDENLIGTSISADNGYVSLFSGGRVMVYSALDGERMGATSFREPVYLADYFPEDNLILALTGSFDENSGVLSDVEFKAIDLERRAITSESFSSSLGFSDAINSSLVRLSSGKYQLKGSSKIVNIRASF